MAKIKCNAITGVQGFDTDVITGVQGFYTDVVTGVQGFIRYRCDNWGTGIHLIQMDAEAATCKP